MGPDAKSLFDLIAHALGPGLRAAETGSQLQIFRFDPGLFDSFRDGQRVGRRAAEHVALHVLHEHDLPGGVACAHGQYRCPDRFCSCMGSQSAGEQPVAVGDVGHIVGTDAAHGQTSGYSFRPVIHVSLGVADDLWLSGRTGRGLDPDDVLHGRRLQSRGIVLRQIFLGDERQQFDVLQSLDVLRSHTGLVHLRRVVGYVLVLILYCGLQPLQLHGPHGLAVRAFHFFVPNHTSVPFVHRVIFRKSVLFPGQPALCLLSLDKCGLVHLYELFFNIPFYDLHPCISAKRKVS